MLNAKISKILDTKIWEPKYIIVQSPKKFLFLGWYIKNEKNSNLLKAIIHKIVGLKYFFQYFKGIHVFTSTYIQLFVKSKGLFKYQEAKNRFFLKLSTIVSINWHLVMWGQVLHHQIFSYDLFWPLFHAFLILGRVFL